jgi:hypothetical protein
MAVALQLRTLRSLLLSSPLGICLRALLPRISLLQTMSIMLWLSPGPRHLAVTRAKASAAQQKREPKPRSFVPAAGPLPKYPNAYRSKEQQSHTALKLSVDALQAVLDSWMCEHGNKTAVHCDLCRTEQGSQLKRLEEFPLSRVQEGADWLNAMLSSSSQASLQNTADPSAVVQVMGEQTPEQRRMLRQPRKRALLIALLSAASSEEARSAQPRAAD